MKQVSNPKPDLEDPSEPSQTKTADSLQDVGEDFLNRYEAIVRFLNDTHSFKDTEQFQATLLENELKLIQIRKDLNGSGNTTKIFECSDLLNLNDRLVQRLNADKKDREEAERKNEKNGLIDIAIVSSCLLVWPYAAKNIYVVYFPEGSFGAKIVPVVVAGGTLALHYQKPLRAAWNVAKRVMIGRARKGFQALTSFSQKKADALNTSFRQCRTVVNQRKTAAAKATRRAFRKLWKPSPD